MGRSLSVLRYVATENGCNLAPVGATDCTNKYAAAARGIWPSKTAENWASFAGCKSIRTAKYWLAATSAEDVSPAGKYAIHQYLMD